MFTRPPKAAPFLGGTALVTLIAGATVLLWHLAGDPTSLFTTATSQTTTARDSDQATPAFTPRRPAHTPPTFTDLPPATPSATRPSIAPDDKTLQDRLDQFYLASVSLDRVPLNTAIGLLQGQLRQLNIRHSADLEKLRVTIPTAAAGRLVTLHTGSITFLKAVRAVASLAGCDVLTQDTTLALVINGQPYPQIAERRNLRDLLAGSLLSDGSDPANDPRRLAALVSDAASLGIAIDPHRPLESQTTLSVTRGQWAALQMLTSARDQLSQAILPNFELYLTRASAGFNGRALDAATAAALREQLIKNGSTPIAIISPNSGPGQSTVPTVNGQPLGEATHFTINLPADDPFQASATLPVDALPPGYEGILHPGEGLTIPLPGDPSVPAGNEPAATELGLVMLPTDAPATTTAANYNQDPAQLNPWVISTGVISSSADSNTSRGAYLQIGRGFAASTGAITSPASSSPYIPLISGTLSISSASP